MSDITAAEVLGAASGRLTLAGFRIGPELRLYSGEQLRCYEDDVSIVGVAQFRSWRALRDGWIDAQSVLVDLLSERLDRRDPKAWEGYLVLLTLDRASIASEVDEIRRDTSRLRKIVATGEDMTSVAQVEDALLPVLPLSGGVLRHDAGSILDRLPGLLARKGIDKGLTLRVLEAFENDRPLMAAVDEWRSEQ
ncbi:MAG: hypothetical protein JJU45_20140 [Acidimicrobiia bacterium]|nr:hypothetical protein [Acidimicrobiia bacterium]